MSLDIISEVQSMERRGNEMIVEVAVRGPVGLDQLKELRARGRAILASGAVPSFVDTVSDIPSGMVRRMTRVQSTNERPTNVEFAGQEIAVLEKLLTTEVITVAVRRDL